MAGVLSGAVTDLRQTSASTIEIKVDGTAYRLTPRMCGQARAEAERDRDPDTDAPLPPQHGPAHVHQLGDTAAGPAARS